MKFEEILKYSLKSVQQRQIRSWLTVLGIVIGIAAVVSLLTIGQGFSDEIDKQLSSFGSNTIFIAPISESQSQSAMFRAPGSSPTSGKLFEKDADRLKKIPDLDEITKLVMGRGTIGFKGKEITSSIMGVEPGIYEKTTMISLEEGRFLLDSDRRVVAIGASVSEDSFGNNKVGVNSFLTLNGKKFRVVGVLKRSGGSFGPTSSIDSGIFVSFKDGQELFKGSLAENEVSIITVTAKEGSDIDEVTDKITAEMAAAHKTRADEKDFSVINSKTFQEKVGSILGMVTAFLGAIASISLLVGGVGIANSMLTSVMERTREIGILKAVGARRDDILKIFILESGALGGLGGVIGVILGSVIAYLANFAGIPVSIRPEMLVFVFLFSVGIGLVSGFIPARRAANLSPVEALRYE